MADTTALGPHLGVHLDPHLGVQVAGVDNLLDDALVSRCLEAA